MYKKQIEYRQSLLNHYQEKEDTIKVLKEILSEQIEGLKSKQKDSPYPQVPNLSDWSQEKTTINERQKDLQNIGEFLRENFGFVPIDSSDESRAESGDLSNRNIAYNYVTAEGVKNSAEKVEKERKTFIMDINLIPSEYKDEDTVKTVENYEQAFNVRIIPIDSSRANMQGGNEAFIRQLF